MYNKLFRIKTTIKGVNSKEASRSWSKDHKKTTGYKCRLTVASVNSYVGHFQGRTLAANICKVDEVLNDCFKGLFKIQTPICIDQIHISCRILKQEKYLQGVLIFRLVNPSYCTYRLEMTAETNIKHACMKKAYTLTDNYIFSIHKDCFIWLDLKKLL